MNQTLPYSKINTILLILLLGLSLGVLYVTIQNNKNDGESAEMIGSEMMPGTPAPNPSGTTPAKGAPTPEPTNASVNLKP